MSKFFSVFMALIALASCEAFAKGSSCPRLEGTYASVGEGLPMVIVQDADANGVITYSYGSSKDNIQEQLVADGRFYSLDGSRIKVVCFNGQVTKVWVLPGGVEQEMTFKRLTATRITLDDVVYDQASDQSDPADH